VHLRNKVNPSSANVWKSTASVFIFAKGIVRDPNTEMREARCCVYSGLSIDGIEVRTSQIVKSKYPVAAR